MNKKIKLCDVLDVQNGYAFDSKFFNDKEGVQLIRIRDLKNGIKTEVKYSADFDEKFLVYKGDYLIGMDGDFICYEWKGEPSLLNQRVCRLVNFTIDIEPKYIYYGINKSLKKIHDSTSFVTVKHISSKQIKEIEFLMIPLEKQKQIAKTLDKANELIELRKESITKLDALAKSIFIDMFGDPIGNPMKWEKKKFVDVCSKVTDGTHHSPPMSTSGYKYITAKHIKENKLNFEKDETYISEEEHRKIFSRCNPVKGDILYIKDGATTGIACINTLDEEFSLLSSVALLKPSNKIKSEYIVSYLNNPSVKNNILLNMAGGAIKRLTIKKIKDINIIVPPIDLQNKFAKIIEKIEEQKSLYTQELEKLQENFDALLQKSFQE